MWLLDTSTLALCEFNGSAVPKYAILSHTWSDEELKFQDMELQDETIREKDGYKKVLRFCDVAKAMGYHFAWVDTACIDKRSSAELSEAINSMYKWYEKADICIIYLEDVASMEGLPFFQQIDSLKLCRWFTRGWTLQEMVACKHRCFYSKHWEPITLDGSTGCIDRMCSNISGVRLEILNHERSVRSVPVAERMSWGARREATRPEDRSYSLMGIFDVHMHVLYGEGEYIAFRRLQEEILKSSYDDTLFAWRGQYSEGGFLARSLDDFNSIPKLRIHRRRTFTPVSIFNFGIYMEVFDIQRSLPEKLQLFRSKQSDTATVKLLCDAESKDGWGTVVIVLHRVENYKCLLNGRWCTAWRRGRCDTLILDPPNLRQRESEPPRKEKRQTDYLVILDDRHQDHFQVTCTDNENHLRDVKLLTTEKALSLERGQQEQTQRLEHYEHRTL